MLYTCQSWVCYSESPVAGLNGRISLPCHTARPNYKEHTGVWVWLCVRAGLRAYSLTCHRGKGLTGFDQCVSCVSTSCKRQLTLVFAVWARWVRPTETDSGDVQRQKLNRCLPGEGCEVKLGCQSKAFWLFRQKVQLTAHNSGIQERKQPACSTCAFSEMKRKKKTNLC